MSRSVIIFTTILNIGIFLPLGALSNQSNCDAEYAVSSKKTWSATMGGANLAQESTSSQQVSYLSKAISAQLDSWGYHLMQDSILINYFYDRQGDTIQRFYYDRNGKVKYYPYVVRSVFFSAINPQGEIEYGSLYLIEQVVTKAKEFIKRNHSAADLQEIKSKKLIRFSLSKSYKDAFEIGLELHLRDFNFTKISSLPTRLSTSKRLEFVRSKLENILVSKFGEKYHILHDSLNFDPYVLGIGGGGRRGALIRRRDYKVDELQFILIDNNNLLSKGRINIIESKDPKIIKELNSSQKQYNLGLSNSCHATLSFSIGPWPRDFKLEIGKEHLILSDLEAPPIHSIR